jgi:hypothetical protein
MKGSHQETYAAADRNQPSQAVIDLSANRPVRGIAVTPVIKKN